MSYKDTPKMKFRESGIEQYINDDVWIVEICGSVDGNTREAWLRHKDYGISMLMFALRTTFHNQFVKLVDERLEEYKAMYREEFMEA